MAELETWPVPLTYEDLQQIEKSAKPLAKAITKAAKGTGA